MRNIISLIGVSALCYMAFHEKGFRSIATPMGQPADTSSAGETRQFHTFVTNDDRPTVETAGYFNVLWTAARRVKKGDLLAVSYDADGLPGHRLYTINIVANVVVLVPEKDTSGGAPRAVIPTADGLTTGLLYDTDTFVEFTSADANHIGTLPLASEGTRDREIHIFVAGATNCELRTPAASNQTINNVDCDGTQEALLTAGNYYIVRQTKATGWILQGFTNLGAVQTAIVPD